jgi:hypothetical protein
MAFTLCEIWEVYLTARLRNYTDSSCKGQVLILERL